MPEVVEKVTRIGNLAVHAAQEENRRKGIANVYSLIVLDIYNRCMI